MSLDVYLTDPKRITGETHRVIFVREDGETKEISRDEWNERYGDLEPVSVETTEEIYWANMTHNLGAMAVEAGIYDHLWRPDENGITKAAQLIAPLTEGVALMRREPERFKALNPENGWGSYAVFVPWIEKYLAACCENLDADVSVSR